MCRHISCLNVIVVLFGSTAALQPSSSTNLIKPKQVYVSEGQDDNQSFSKIPADQMETKAGEYHRAVGVARGQCTKKMKPNLLFIGQAYSGTTSLAAQMKLHPELSCGDTKEHKYFQRDFNQINSANSWENYLETFWVDCNTTVAFDATPGYITVAEGTKSVPGEQSVRYIHSRLGDDVKIMMMFRDPVDLMFSRQCRGDRDSKKRPFTVDEPYNVTSGGKTKFAALLSIWQKVFTNKTNWLFLSSDEYFANPEKVLKKVYKFVGVNAQELSKDEVGAQHGRRRCSFKATAAEREAYWSVKDNLEDKHTLESLTGLKFYWQAKG